MGDETSTQSLSIKRQRLHPSSHYTTTHSTSKYILDSTNETDEYIADDNHDSTDMSIPPSPPTSTTTSKHSVETKSKRIKDYTSTKHAKSGRLEFQSFASNVNTTVDKLINETIPSYILQLNTYLHQNIQPYVHTVTVTSPPPPSSSSSSEDQSSSSSSATATDNWVRFGGYPRNTSTNDTVATRNHYLSNTLQPYVREVSENLLDTINTLKLYIQLHIPTIEEGNNLGVEIQEEVLNEYDRVESNVFSILDSINKYIQARARVGIKRLKYPYIDDYAHTLRQMDESHYVTLKLSITELRNYYIIAYDMYMKNYERIQEPKGTNHMRTMI